MASNFARSSGLSGFSSIARTRAPCFISSSIAASPDLFVPITRMFFPTSSKLLALLPQLQSRQRKQRHDKTSDPEAHDYLRFRPAQCLEVVMNRRHFENTFSVPKLIAPHLQNHRQSFDYVNAANKHKQNLLLDQHRDYP